MLGNNPKSFGVGGLVACGRSPEVDEALEERQVADTIGRVSAGFRLLRVLVVDDYKDAADSLALLVKVWGHTVRLAYDGAAAFEMTLACQPDVLLLDIAMPKLDGFSLARQLRRQTRFQETLLVAITGYADEAHRWFWEGAFDHYLIKPVEPSTLDRLLRLERDRLARSPAAVRGTDGNGWEDPPDDVSVRGHRLLVPATR